MIYFLDTNICIFHLNNSSPSATKRLYALPTKQVKLPSIVVAELFYGANKSLKREQNIQKYKAFCSIYDIAGFDCAAAEIYGEIRAGLERKGVAIGWNDMLIAAIAKSNDGVVVTNNISEFSRVDGLKFEDWTIE